MLALSGAAISCVFLGRGFFSPNLLNLLTKINFFQLPSIFLKVLSMGCRSRVQEKETMGRRPKLSLVPGNRGFIPKDSLQSRVTFASRLF
jgi:hypothetical protein